MSAAHSRRRRTLRPWVAHALAGVAGFALGLGGSFVKPGPWFAPADALEVAQRVAPGLVLTTDDRASSVLVLPDSVRLVGPPPAAAGAAVVVRGPHEGRRAFYALCAPPRSIQLDGMPATAWRPAGRDLADLIGRAVCDGHPMTTDRYPKGERA